MVCYENLPSNPYPGLSPNCPIVVSTYNIELRTIYFYDGDTWSRSIDSSLCLPSYALIRTELGGKFSVLTIRQNYSELTLGVGLSPEGACGRPNHLTQVAPSPLSPYVPQFGNLYTTPNCFQVRQAVAD